MSEFVPIHQIFAKNYDFNRPDFLQKHEQFCVKPELYRKTMYLKQSVFACNALGQGKDPSLSKFS